MQHSYGHFGEVGIAQPSADAPTSLVAQVIIVVCDSHMVLMQLCRQRDVVDGLWKLGSGRFVPLSSTPTFFVYYGLTSVVFGCSSYEVDDSRGMSQESGHFMHCCLGSEDSPFIPHYLLGTYDGTIHGIDEWQCNGGVLCQQPEMHCVMFFLPVDTAYLYVNGTSFFRAGCKVYAMQKEHHGRPVQPSGSCNGDRLVPSSLGV